MVTEQQGLIITPSYLVDDRVQRGAQESNAEGYKWWFDHKQTRRAVDAQTLVTVDLHIHRSPTANFQ